MNISHYPAAQTSLWFAITYMNNGKSINYFVKIHLEWDECQGVKIQNTSRWPLTP